MLCGRTGSIWKGLPTSYLLRKFNTKNLFGFAVENLASCSPSKLDFTEGYFLWCQSAIDRSPRNCHNTGNPRLHRPFSELIPQRGNNGFTLTKGPCRVGDRLDAGQSVGCHRAPRIQLECGVPSTFRDPSELAGEFPQKWGFASYSIRWPALTTNSISDPCRNRQYF